MRFESDALVPIHFRCAPKTENSKIKLTFSKEAKKPVIKSGRLSKNGQFIRGDVKFKMIIRMIKRFYKKRMRMLREEVPMSNDDFNFLSDLFTSKNYQPRNGPTTYRSYNKQFKERIFAMASFCSAFMLFLGKSLSWLLDKQTDLVIDRASFHYGENAKKDFQEYLTDLKRDAELTLGGSNDAVSIWYRLIRLQRKQYLILSIYG